jgi:hypothetical protein
MDEPKPIRTGLLAELLNEEHRLWPRLSGVFRFDASVYTEIERDPAALTGAFAVVIATGLLVGLGAPSLAEVFIGVTGAILVWAVSTALVWGASALLPGGAADYSRLLTCLGFAYAWRALGIGASLPGIGVLLEWGAIGLWAAALVQATRQVLRIPTERALLVCGLALLTPLLLLLAIAG